MALATIGVTTGYTLSSSVPTQIATGPSAHRRLIIIDNLSSSIVVYVAFGTGNAASATVGHAIATNSRLILGGVPSYVGESGPPVPTLDISMIAASGSPAVAVTIVG